MMNDIRDRADRGYFYITFTIPLIYKNVKNVENESIKFKAFKMFSKFSRYRDLVVFCKTTHFGNFSLFYTWQLA